MFASLLLSRNSQNVIFFRVDERGQNKMTPLHYAARYGKIDGANARDSTKSEKTWQAIAFLMMHSNDKSAALQCGHPRPFGEQCGHQQ